MAIFYYLYNDNLGQTVLGSYEGNHVSGVAKHLQEKECVFTNKSFPEMMKNGELEIISKKMYDKIQQYGSKLYHIGLGNGISVAHRVSQNV